MQKTTTEVREFLGKIQVILEDGFDNLIVLSRVENDKTDIFMKESNVTHNMICEEILKLDESNYSYTENDKNPKWSHEEIWIFGQTFFREDINYLGEMYIKLKLRKSVVCMSFHPKEHDIYYPYN